MVSMEKASTDSRPQKSFKDLVDNSYQFPFIPKLKEKPNALILLNSDIVKAQSNPKGFFEQIVILWT